MDVKRGDIIKMTHLGSAVIIGKVQREQNEEDVKSKSIKFDWVIDSSDEYHKDVIAFVDTALIIIV